VWYVSQLVVVWLYIYICIWKIVCIEWGVDQPALWAANVGNSWRTTSDIGNSWNSIITNIDIVRLYYFLDPSRLRFLYIEQ
jgi:hypothetical protein